MSMLPTYRQYFDIDPDYIPAVNEAVIKKNPEMWKKFYPHETFVKLLKNMISVLERKQKLCLWVEGAYGTGKSHAVLTLKKLLDSSEQDTKEYFARYDLDKDLYNRFQAIKGAGKILTVHRYGSASIRGDDNLVFAIQESIEKALSDADIENKGGNSIKAATIAWLSDSVNKDYFNKLITGKFSNIFNGRNVDDVLTGLNTYSGDALTKLMDNISEVADKSHIKAMSMSIHDLCDWIREIIHSNNLYSIVFIWDEFSEYFYNNSRGLTGFQELCELSESEPFYFVIVSHSTQSLFHEDNRDFKKLNGRFVSPHCLISLPENIAFQLMGAALSKKDDPDAMDEWEVTLGDLSTRTRDSRELVKKVAHITDKEMRDILPLHPYAALLLKYISSAFDSNQRSMFDFIENDRGDEIKGFQWFIDNYGPTDDNPLLSVDMLWDFFYENGKDYLAHDIRSILDYYNQSRNHSLNSDQKRVLKAVLLFLAISQKAGESVELFIPNEKNINNAFEGTDLDNAAARCANQLVRDKVLYQKPIGGGKFQYAIYNNESELDISEQEKTIDKQSTSAFIKEELTDKTTVSDAVTLGGALKLRYDLRYVSLSDFDSNVRYITNNSDSSNGKIAALVCFAKDEKERIVIGQKIEDSIKNGNDTVFIDATYSLFTSEGFADYRREMAYSMASSKIDQSLSSQHAKDAKEYLKKWKNRISTGEFTVYTLDKPQGERVATLDALYTALKEIDRKKYPDGLESAYTVIDNMYSMSSMKQGVECACNEKTAGTFSSSNPLTKLENALGGAWQVPEYWKKQPFLLISKIKLRVDEIINKGFERNGKISIKEIYDILKAAPYGFMPCNLSAFILGFVLKEYTSGTYSWSDNLTTDILSVAKLKEMIDEVIHLDVTPNSRYRDKYIVAMTAEEKAFNEITSVAFDIPLNLCSSIPNTRERIRGKMKEYSFPIWTIKYILESETTKTDSSILGTLIDSFCGIANSNNLGSSKSESDIAMAIGKLALSNPDAGADLKTLLTKENCRRGMTAYLETFDGGELVQLANDIGDNGQYINALSKKFDADAAKWVWNIDTVQQKIREVILEYRIIAESNKVISKTSSYENAIREWCDKCGYIRISYSAAKNYLGELGPFLGVLHDLKKSGMLKEQQKQSFPDMIRANAAAFRDFYVNQTDLFKQVCGYYLDMLSDDDIKEVFAKLPTGVFTSEKKDYFENVEKIVKVYNENQKSTRLKAYWKEHTGSESPSEWSKKHKMPILCLIPDSELPAAKSAFATVNRAKADESSIKRAQEYLESAKFYNILNDDAALNRAFRENIIKSYSVMLTDIQEVKDYLDSHINADPYDWYGLPEIDKKLCQMAEAKYNQGGCERALEKIDEMNTDDVKRYLKELIRDNMVVGMEIIKNN